MSWDYNFVSPDDNIYIYIYIYIYIPHSPDHNIKYIVRTISIKWWDKYEYNITKITGLPTNQFIASNQNKFFLKKSIN